VEKGSKISVFRFGLVGPKFELNLVLKTGVFFFGAKFSSEDVVSKNFILVERKGNWLIFQYFLYKKRFKEETPLSISLV